MFAPIRPHDGSRLVLIAALLAALAVAAVPAGVRAADSHAPAPLTDVPIFTADFVDPDLAKLEDTQSEGLDQPPRFAVPQETFIAPETHGLWERIAEDTMLWRLRIASPGALSLNLGFTRYAMPEGGRLRMIAADDPTRAYTFDAGDNKAHGQLWTPLLETGEVILEVTLPVKAADRLDLLLERVNTGYRRLGDLFPEKSGACNIDVICAEGDDWRQEIQTVAVYQRGGSFVCTGFMINNTTENETPYFMTATHCGINSSTDASLVVYWNYFSPICGEQTGGDLSQNQTGATFLVGDTPSDYTLVQLDAAPDPDWNVAYAGWDNSGIAPASAVAIHHPGTDEKSISFENDPLATTSYLGDISPGNGTHLRVEDWDLGTTEGGSSGSPLFDPNHRVVGQLHGGYAACGNNDSDWYGKISVSWSGLSTYLDPLDSGAETLDTLAPYASGMHITGGVYDLAGDAGGPFTPASYGWTVTNTGETALDYAVGADVDWLDIAPASGTLAAGSEVTVTVTPNAAAEALDVGSYHAALEFVNLTNHTGDAVRAANLQVGVPELIHAWTMDADPGWTAEGDWQWGVPQGAGGQYGNADPEAGFTGTGVYGYNLAGDYPNGLPERHLTTTAIDCTHLEAVTLKFHRWLNVERPLYDHAYLRISTDGQNWAPLWDNDVAVTDDAWSQVSYDISAIADGAATLYVRWTMGTTDGSWQYSGWNIDDVEIWALQSNLASGNGGPNRRPATLLPNVPNPFNPMTTVAFVLDAPARATLAVYDLRGRRVETLVDEPLAAGRHEAVWDGLDARGAAVPSGEYVFRLEAGGETQVRKALLVR